MHVARSLPAGQPEVQQLLQQQRLRRPQRHARLSLTTRAGPPKLKRPDSGFFAEADPKSEVLPVRRSLQADPTKRGGRWQSDFIWNSDWAAALDYDESLRRQQAEGASGAGGAGTAAAANGGDGQKGFLSLARAKLDLNSMDVDLSAQLKPRKEARRSDAAAAAGKQRRRSAADAPNAGYPLVPATRLETRQWDRSGKFSRRVVPLPPPEAEAAEAAARRAEELARYKQLQQELQLWALGLTAACLTATLAFYGPDTAASYGAGALGGLVYLRMLHQSVDGMGSGGVGSALSSNRLLIPLILVLGYNRYNLLAADQVGLTLQLLPMLVGFFTYKGAVVARQSLVVFSDLTEAYRRPVPAAGAAGRGGAAEGEASPPDDGDVSNVDRAFTRRTLLQ